MSLIVSNKPIDVFQSEFEKSQSPFMPLLSTVLEPVDLMMGGASHQGGETKLESIIDFASGTDLEEAEDAVRGLSAMAKSVLNSAKRHSTTGLDRLELPLALLKKLKIESDDNRMIMKTSLTKGQEKLLDPLIEGISQTRAAAIRVDSANKIRQLSLALHNYASVYGHFPPPVLVSPQGKKYSWRVAILPFVEQQGLYDSYRFDEEWNSEHNLKVTANTPVMFQHQLAMAGGSKFCSYFVITGDRTAFPTVGEGMKFETFLDGTSNTIAIVEAKKDVHWAEPRDIAFADGKLDTELGGFTSGGFNTSMCDGSVRFLSHELNESTLRKLIDRADGEVINQNELNFK